MPGGRITVKQDLPDLQSYLARKRYPLDKWLLANNITSQEALISLINSKKWIVGPELQQMISELLKPVFVAPEPVVAPVEPTVVEPVVEPTVEPMPEPEVVAEQTQEVIEQPTFAVEETVASVAEEPTSIVEEVSLVSSQSFKERKKSR